MILAAAYVLTGILFSIVFLTFGVNRLDPAAKSSGLAFRLIIFPGCVALWPLLALKWLRGEVVQ